ncbi:MAG: hypothetical protein ACRCYD_01865 [Plesiomonas sp.]
MSVQINHYGLIGAKLGWNEYHDLMKDQFGLDELKYECRLDEFETPFQDSAFDGIYGYDGLTVIADGMNGEYVYIGAVYMKIDDNGREHKADKLEESEVWEKIMKHFQIDCKVDDFTFTHCR